MVAVFRRALQRFGCHNGRMFTIRLLIWVLVAWLLPALLAAAFGWHGIWGSGSVITDFLIPLPVAGGVLHVPSFAAATAAVLLLPNLAPAAASRWRAVLIGAAIAGLLLLLNLQFILAALKTGDAMPRIWDQNPLGLFLLSDALLALLFTANTPQRPWMRLEVMTLLLLLLPSAWPLSMALPRAGAVAAVEFSAGTSQHGEQRGDEMLMVHTRLDPAAPDFRARAEAWAMQPQAMAHPRFHVSAESQALLFTRDAEAARRMERGKVAATLCLYEDETPPRWMAGAGDCFSGHINFSGKVARAAAALPAEEAAELRWHLAATELCALISAKAAPEAQGLQLTSDLLCGNLARERAQLRQRHPEDPRLRDPGA